MWRYACLVVGILLVAGCGGSGSTHSASQVAPMNGTWATTSATPATGPVPPGFSFTMMEGGGSMMSLSGMKMLNTTGCFGEDSHMVTNATMSGGMMGGGMMGPGTQVVMDLWSDAAHTGNHLHMVMTMNGSMNGMTGTYTLEGVTPGCMSGSGTMSMGRR